MSINSSPPVFEPAKPPDGELTLAELQDHLKTAVFVEMSTIPLYLYAYFSIKPEGSGNAARTAIRGVAVEEMLHLALAGNILNALGKRPILYGPHHIPTYPSEILFTPITMDLQPGFKTNMKVFVDIEKPAPPEDSDQVHILSEYKSIGLFYETIKYGLGKHQESINKDTVQITDEDDIYYDPGLVSVVDFTTATKAIKTIVDQGEGANHDGGHYKIFQNLYAGSNDWNCHPIAKNPKTEWYRGQKFYEVLLTFDAAYCYLLLNIEKLWQIKDKPRREDCSNNINAIMKSILVDLVEFLQKKEVSGDEVTLAPCFNLYGLNAQNPLQALKDVVGLAVVKYDGQLKEFLKDVQKKISDLKELPPVI